MNLKLLGIENFQEIVCYDVVYLDEPYVYEWGKKWLTGELRLNSRIFSIGHWVFETIDAPFRSFSFYDEYGITDFYGEDAKKLIERLSVDKETIAAYDEKAFKKRFYILYDLIEDEDYRIKEKPADVTACLREDLIEIINTLIDCLNKAIIENKSLTIIGA